MTEDITPLNLEQFADELDVETDEYAINMPIEDGDDPRKVRGTGASFDEAMADAEEKVAERREELGLVE